MGPSQRMVLLCSLSLPTEGCCNNSKGGKAVSVNIPAGVVNTVRMPVRSCWIRGTEINGTLNLYHMWRELHWREICIFGGLMCHPQTEAVWLSVFFCLSVSLPVFVSVSVCRSLSRCLWLFLYPSIFLSLSVSLSVSTFPSLAKSLSLSLYPVCVSLSISVSQSLSLSLSVSPSLFLSLWLPPLSFRSGLIIWLNNIPFSGLEMSNMLYVLTELCQLMTYHFQCQVTLTLFQGCSGVVQFVPSLRCTSSLSSLLQSIFFLISFLFSWNVTDWIQQCL